MHGVVCTLHMHVSDVIVQNFGTKFLLRRGDCKTRENPIFSKRANCNLDKKNPKFILWILDDETNFTVGIVSQNLASTSNFVEFRDSRNLHVFRGIAYRVPKNDL